MKSKLTKWGNSMALRIPKKMLDELGWKADDEIQIVVEAKKLIIQKRERVYLPKYTLEELLEGITDENCHEEIGTGYAVGKEVWD